MSFASLLTKHNQLHISVVGKKSFQIGGFDFKQPLISVSLILKVTFMEVQSSQ